jgi:hypothetical protein
MYFSQRFRGCISLVVIVILVLLLVSHVDARSVLKEACKGKGELNIPDQ